MPQTKEVRGVATTVRTEGKTTHVRYHATDVVSFNDEEITLRAGGHLTYTTKLRMNQTATQYNLGFRVFQKNKEWFVDIDGDGNVAPFTEGMTIRNRW